MLILGIESTAKSASVALSRDGRLAARYFQNGGLTHSRTLLPMAEAMLRHAGTDFGALDAVAVAQGPGSFTGVRIGVATAKGLCWGADKPAVGVSTLEAMAWNGETAAPGTLLCCAMDARRSQVYNALFRWEDGAPRRLTPDRAISLPQLAEELRALAEPALVLGDGGELCAGFLREAGLEAVLAPEAVRYQDAWGVCRAAEGKQPQDAAALLPVYLRLSQAERERLEKLKQRVPAGAGNSPTTALAGDRAAVPPPFQGGQDTERSAAPFRETLEDNAGTSGDHAGSPLRA